MYGIPKSILALYKSRKPQIGMKPEQSPSILAEEVKILVEYMYVLHMSGIGNGRTKE